MITNIRKQFKGAAYKASLWVLIFAFIVGYAYIPGLFKGQGDLWAIKVNNSYISYKTFIHEVDQKRAFIDSFRAQYGQYADMILGAYGFSLDPKVSAYDDLVRETLLKNYFAAHAVVLGKDYFSIMATDKDFLRNEFGDHLSQALLNAQKQEGKQFCALLKKIGFTPEEFENKLEDIIRKKWFFEFLSATHIGISFDKKGYYDAQYSKKTYSLFSLPREQVRAQVKKGGVDKAEVDAYYTLQNTLSKKYWMGERRSGYVWTLKPSVYDVVISDDKVAEYYHKNIARYVETPAQIKVRSILIAAHDNADDAALQKAQSIHAQLVSSPALFEELAKQLSDDEGAKKNGGLSGYIKKGDKEKPFEYAAFALSQVGDISNVVVTSRGYEIIQLVEKIEKKVKPLNAVQAEIKKELVKKESQQRFAHELADCTRLNNDLGALAVLMEKRGAVKKDFNAVVLDGTPVIQKLFELKPGSIGSLTEGDNGLIVYLSKVDGAYCQPLEEVYEHVVADLIEEKTTKELEVYMSSIKKGLAAGKSLKELALNTKEASYKESGSFKDADQKGLEAFLGGVIDAREAGSLEKVGTCLSVVGPLGLYITTLIAMDPSADRPVDSNNKEWDLSRSNILLEGLVASLYKNANIETNEQVFSRC